MAVALSDAYTYYLFLSLNTNLHNHHNNLLSREHRHLILQMVL